MSKQAEENPKARGGYARAKALTPAERRESARIAAQARWAGDLPRSTHEGPVHIGDQTIQAAVLTNGKRVLSQGTFLRAIGRSRTPKAGTGVLSTTQDRLPFFLQAERLDKFITEELREAAAPIEYLSKTGRPMVGYDAELLPMVCEVYLRFRDASLDKVPRQYARIVAACDMLTRGLARVGIIALVDEATGFQYVRDRMALQAILDKYIGKELAAWVKRFPDEFYDEIYRLRRWERKAGQSSRRPILIGQFTNDIVYQRLAPGILDELRERNPLDDRGRRRARHHQWLTEDIGHPALARHLHAVIVLMRASNSWNQFKALLDQALPKLNSTRMLPFMPEVEVRAD